ncbi:hypothetical protein [Leeia sp.]|uniref:hypothetical protein n=1 Tax=Leeia sp. TaxID=2884678 RepID=UPI0035ADA5EA
MRPPFLVLLALLLNVATALANPTDNCSAQRAHFLGRPNAAHFHALAQNHSCATALTEDNAALQQLQKRVVQGHPWAARYLAQLLPGMDGGNLEDGLLALGLFADTHPTTLLQMAHDGELSLRNMKDALIMHPATLTEDRTAQIAGLQRRLRKIQQIKRSTLQVEQTEAEQALQQAIAMVEALAHKTEAAART